MKHIDVPLGSALVVLTNPPLVLINQGFSMGSGMLPIFHSLVCSHTGLQGERAYSIWARSVCPRNAHTSRDEKERKDHQPPSHNADISYKRKF